MKLVLLRHGQSVWNKENKFTGWTDVELTKDGKKEAHEAGKIFVKIMAALLAVLMVLAVSATLIYYLLH